MEFGRCKICCGSGDWAIMGKFVSAPWNLHYAGLFIMGYDVTNYVTVGNLYVWGNLMSVDEETRVFSLNIYDTFE